jgi:hypothetical protein
MSAVLRLVENDRHNAPTMSPASLAARTSPSMKPTLVPSSRATMYPSRLVRISESPPTQRSAGIHPLFEAAAQLDAKNLLAVTRMNAEFLVSLLHDHTSPLAIDALQDLLESVEKLERRFSQR